jgi:selenocysteine lyase/cysteine desulfurase
MKQYDSATPDPADTLQLDLAALRADTPGCEHVVHFNNAGCGLVPKSVLAAMIDHLQLESRIGGYEAAAVRADEIRSFYTEIAELIGAGPENIAFAGSATQAYSTALSSIPFEFGDVILTTRNDFISNQIAFLSLRRRFGIEVVHAPDSPEGGVDVETMATLMRSLRPRLVAVTHVPTNSGLVQPVAEIGRHCRELGLLYIVDACQSVGQMSVDVKEIGCDLLTATCRKFLRGPRASGFLFVSNEVLSAGYEPLFIDMHGAEWASADKYEPVASAARFEEWEFPYAAMLGCAAAARYATQVGLPTIAVRARTLASNSRIGLQQIPGVRLLDRGPELGAIVTFAIERWSPESFKRALDERRINSALSFRNFAQFDFTDKDVDWCIRLSPHYFNTESEVDEVTAIVEELATHADAR